MEQMILTQFNLLPEHLKLEVLRYIQTLLQVKADKPSASPNQRPGRSKPKFQDFSFPENGQTYSRSEIYGDDGR